ncbi:RsmB/NOP family class I SAM-dependent RNA methyltransferase [Pseudochrobactrum sp. HB0163]|uniref:RsmB/NOP family class I SAM-dependent RNA methyltransferase n=1 Tax=Pseudochrobactrum sp. HB0163 TaxID=3450708 RepID=UPI003F6E2851
MRLGGRLRAAIEVLEDINRHNRAAADALKDWGSAHRFAGAGDRAVIGNIVYDVLRRKLSLGWRIGADDAHALVYASVLGDPDMGAQWLEAGLAGDRFAPAPLPAERLRDWQNRDLAQAPDYVRADIAPQWVAEFSALFGGDWVEQAAALAGRPPVDLRVNTLKANRDQVLKALEDLKNAGAQPAPYLQEAVRIPPLKALGRHPNMQSEQAFLDGWYEVQDLGSQLAARLVGAQPNHQIMDYCAGAGGKTLALAAAMHNKGQIHAYDAERSRLNPIHERLNRAGVRNTQVHNRLENLEPCKGRMDIVLTDAPCTGSGTWRRRPDAKWRLTEAQLERRLADQAQVLEAAKHYVKPGGRLVYVTCSLFAAENNRQIAHFLENNADYTALPMPQQWNVLTDQAQPCYPDYGAVFSPLSTGTDGFYIAILQNRN